MQYEQQMALLYVGPLLQRKKWPLGGGVVKAIFNHSYNKAWK